MNDRIVGRITLNLIAEIIVTVVTVILAIVWMADRQNEQARAGSETMVLGGISAMEDNVKAFANDYAWWEAGYEGYMSGDKAWIDENFGSGIVDTQISDIIVIISTGGEVEYGYAIDEDRGTPAEIFTPHVAEIEALVTDMPLANDAARVGYFTVGDDILLIAVNRITPVSRAAEMDPATLPLLIQGIYLNEARMHALGTQFLIDDVHLELGEPAPETVAAGFPVIRDLDGRTIGAFVWTPPTPGDEVLRQVLGPVAAALALFVLFALGAAYRTRRLAMRIAQSEKEALVASRTDSLTRLMNRNGFSELLESARFSEACAAGELALIYLDVNGFKTVNDSIGHHGGDELVKALAERLASVLPADTMLARIGGDELAVAIAGPGAAGRVAGTASAMVHAFDTPFMISGFEFHVTAAVGYAVASGPETSPEELLRRADLAMYQAKNAAERDAVAYHSTMETGALEKKQVEAALRKAVEVGELKVAYQPIVRAGDLSVVSLEVLVRWHSREFGAISPGLFIPVAEETGLIHEIGRFVFAQACQDLERWPALKIAVNVSPVQLRDPNFANDLTAILDRYGREPGQFELELTEGILVSNPAIAKRKLAALKELGFGLSLDDFGTGFSSIGYLRQFPFDKLKVDRSFVREIGMNTTANALIQALVSLGDAMELAVVAEGIENDEQLSLLRLVQCEFIQGFHVAKPMPADDLAALLAASAGDRPVLARARTIPAPRLALAVG